jgi:hypothetical protein
MKAVIYLLFGVVRKISIHCTTSDDKRCLPFQNEFFLHRLEITSFGVFFIEQLHLNLTLGSLSFVFLFTTELMLLSIRSGSVGNSCISFVASEKN